MDIYTNQEPTVGLRTPGAEFFTKGLGQMSNNFALEHMSVSRLQRRKRCERADWWHVEGSRGGYRSDASETAKAAYRLKRMSSLPALIGQLLHEMAAMRARDLRDGRRPLDEESMWALMRSRLNRAVRPPRLAGQFGRAGRREPPNEHRGDGMDAPPPLREIALGEWPGGRIPPAVAAAAAEQARGSLRRMLSHPVWEEVAECGAGDVLQADALDALPVDIGSHQLHLFAAPDLVWRSNRRAELPSYGVPLLPPVLYVVDWKSGRADRWQESARAVLATYAGWTMDKHNLTGTPHTVVGWIAALGDPDGGGDLQLVLSQADLAAARGLVIAEGRRVAEARRPDGTVPMESTMRQLDGCRFCAFTSLCLNDEVAPTP